MNNTYVLTAIFLCAFFTVLIRFLPFLVFKNVDSLPPILEYISKTLPYATMAMLVVYCFKNISFMSISTFVPELLAGFVVIISYVWKRNTLISILCGTIIYMVLIQKIF